MRILHVTRELGGDRRYGIGRALSPTLQALHDRGHDVDYLTQDALTSADRRDQAAWIARAQAMLQPAFGAAGHVVGLVLGERLHMGAVAARHAHAWRADVVHLHDPWLAAGYALQARWQGTLRPWGLTQHGFGCYTEAIREEGVPATPWLLRAQRRLEARVLAAARFLACPTAAARLQLRRDVALPDVPAHWHVLPHALSGGFAVAPESECFESLALRRQKLGLTAERPLVLAVGRLNPVKRMEAIVKACLQLQRPLQLLILGDGDSRPLFAMAAPGAAHGFTLDLQLVAEVRPYLQACDVYVSASRNESFGLANLEALAAGAPAICTAVGGVPEVTGGAAWLVPGGDEGLDDRLADALGTLLDHPAERAAWSARGQRHAAHWPGPQEVAACHEAVYRTLV